MNTRFDRSLLRAKPLSERVSKLDLPRDMIDPDTADFPLDSAGRRSAAAAAREIETARAGGAPVVLAFGAHSIKNGLARVMMRLMDGGFVTHFATNGAGVIHDWEFAFQGRTGEDVRRYVSEGQFGIWEETGTYLNLALAAGAFQGLGYGESVGAMVESDGIPLPTEEELSGAVGAGAAPGADGAVLERSAAAADLRSLLATLGGRDADIRPGTFLSVVHPWKEVCLSAATLRAGVPFTCHPMFGHDIIYTHPANRGAPIGRTAERDFLSFAGTISRIEGGVYLSVGSAVMSPMIFEKALSMARNVAHARGERIARFSIHVVDIAGSSWDWNADGEPPQDNPAYYLRYCKTFSRMGGSMEYTGADNRAWLLGLLRALEA